MNAPLDAAPQPYVLCETTDGVATLTLNRGGSNRTVTLESSPAGYAAKP